MICGRARSDDANHDGAFFELFLHELFIRLGLSVKVQPKIESGKVPDFLVSSASGTAFVEATYLKQPLITPSLEKPVLNALNELDTEVPSGIGLIVRIEGELEKSPPLKGIKRAVLEWLNDLNTESVHWDSNLTRTITVDRKFGIWRLELEAVPRSTGRSLIVAGPARLSNRNPEKALHDAVDKKSLKYSDLPHPLVVAANVSSHEEYGAEVSALFGPEALRLTKDSSTGKLVAGRIVRTGKGLWFNNVQGTIRNNRLNGLMVFRNLAPWTVANVSARLYLNPFVADFIPDELRALGYASSVDGELVIQKGERCVRSLFGMEADWPGI